MKNKNINASQSLDNLEKSLCFLKGATLFSGISEKDLAILNDACQMRSYQKDKILFLEEEAAESFYVVCSGWIKLFHTLPEGKEIITDMVTIGAIVGLGALFEDGVYTTNAQVADDVQLLILPLNLTRDHIRHSPTLAFNLLGSMFKLYRRHITEIALNSARRAPQRLGNFLLRLCPKDKEKNIVIRLPYDKALIAQTLGMTRGSFSRALNILRSKTSIRIIGSQVEIDSTEKLKRFVYGQLARKHAPERR